jgi:uncharacterized protein with PhoU and TrkA domain
MLSEERLAELATLAEGFPSSEDVTLSAGDLAALVADSRQLREVCRKVLAAEAMPFEEEVVVATQCLADDIRELEPARGPVPCDWAVPKE